MRYGYVHYEQFPTKIDLKKNYWMINNNQNNKTDLFMQNSHGYYKLKF